MLTDTAVALPDDAVNTLGIVYAPTSERRVRQHAVTETQVVHSVRRANSLPKRIVDLAIAWSAIIALLPLLIPVALCVKVSDGGPILFGHRRAGRYSKEFRCWKFRSMRVDGDEILERHFAAHPEALVEWRETQKLESDPRVTPIGRFLRATSIDELPQLFNVVFGEMSIVGPRPVPRAELNERYGKNRRYYLLVRPGITGLWQVSGRSNTTYERRVELDRAYASDWSLKQDFEILLKTIPAVLKAEGAR